MDTSDRSELPDRLILLQAVPDLMFRLDSVGTVLDCHTPTSGPFRARSQEFMGRRIGEVLPPEVGERFEHALELTLSTREHQRLEYRMELEGRAVDVEARLLPRGDGEVVAVARDMTQQKRAEIALRESEERYHTLFDAVSDAIFVFELDSLRFLNVNDAAIRAYGYSRQEFMDMRITDVSAEPEETLDAIRRTARASQERIPARLHRRKDGSLFPVEISASSVVLGNKHVVCSVLRDITTRRQAEEQLRSLTSQLVLAEERERRRIAADLHDRLAQNLAMCLMRVALLQESAEWAEAESLQQVRDLLEGSLKQAQSLTFELSPPALYDLGLEEALRSLGERLLAEHGVQFAFHAQGQLPQLSDDVRVLLFRAVRELFVNVIKHARASRVNTTVELREGTLRIVVADDGDGLGSSQSGGLAGGFGLLNVRERLQHIGGQLELSGAPGAGTRVCLSLPWD